MEKNKAPHADMLVNTALQVRAGRPRRILVVDDDKEIRQLNASVLALSGYHVDAAADTEPAQL